MFTKKTLLNEISSINESICKNTKNELKVGQAYGGYQVQLTGKRRKDGKGWRGLGTSCVDITQGFTSGREALDILKKLLFSGELKRKINIYEDKQKK